MNNAKAPEPTTIAWTKLLSFREVNPIAMFDRPIIMTTIAAPLEFFSYLLPFHTSSVGQQEVK